MFTMLRLGHFRLLPNAAQLTGLYSFVLVVVRQMHLHAISSLRTPPRIITRISLHYFAQLFHMRLRYNYATLVSFSLPYYSIYSFSFLSTVAFNGLNTIKYCPKGGSVMHLSYSRGFIIL